MTGSSWEKGNGREDVLDSPNGIVFALGLPPKMAWISSLAAKMPVM